MAAISEGSTLFIILLDVPINKSFTEKNIKVIS